MKKHLIFITSIFISIYFSVVLANGLDDTLTIVNGFVYETAETNPLENVTVYWYQFDSLGNNIGNDSVYTNAEGKFTDTITKGIYSFYPSLQFYRQQNTHYNLELTDSVSNLDFILFRPVMSLSDDSLTVEVSKDGSVQYQLTVQNAGSGDLAYSCALYLRDEIPDDLDQINPGGSSGEIPAIYYGSPDENSWKLLLEDQQDLEPGQHDIKSLWTQVIDGTFYLKVDFYEEIGSLTNMYFEFWLNTDPDPDAGHPDAGFEYLILVNGTGGFLMAPFLDYASGNYYLLSDPIYTNMNEDDDFIVLAYPVIYLADYDIILSRATTKKGTDDFSYVDYAPDLDAGYNILFSVKSNPSIHLNKYYGESDGNNSDTITLTIQSEIIDDTLDHFFIGFYSNDAETPVSIVPVNLQKPAIIQSNSEINTGQSSPLCIYPNPVFTQTTIQYNLEQKGEIRLIVYNSEGKPVNVLADGIQEAGNHSVKWNGKDLQGNRVQAGLYICSLMINGKLYQEKLLFMHD